MKKKLFISIMVIVMASACAFGLSACGNNSDSADRWGNVYTLETAYATAKDLGYSGTLEEFIESISGKDGKDGLGVTEALINNDGELIIVFSNGTTKNLGKVVAKDGADGKDGENGLSAFEIYKKYHPDYTGTEQDWLESLKGTDGNDGKDGVGIKYAYINSDGELILVLTNDTTINCGKVSNNDTKEPDNDGDTQIPDSEDIEFGLPLTNINIINGFDFIYDKTLERYYMHQGIDFEAPAGTKVFAVADGIVTQVVTDIVFGESYVTIAHGNDITTTYKYIIATEGLEVGDTVKRGDVIGSVAPADGMEMKDGEHLHFAININGKAVDPADYLDLK